MKEFVVLLFVRLVYKIMDFTGIAKCLCYYTVFLLIPFPLFLHAPSAPLWLSLLPFFLKRVISCFYISYIL